MTYEVMGIPAMAINKIIKFLWYNSFKSPQNKIKTFLIYFIYWPSIWFFYSFNRTTKKQIYCINEILKKIMAMNFGCIVYATWKLDINKNAEKKFLLVANASLASKVIIYKSRGEQFYRTEYEIWAGFGLGGSCENFGLGRKVWPLIRKFLIWTLWDYKGSKFFLSLLELVF